jgi:hypothetical protein
MSIRNWTAELVGGAMGCLVAGVGIAVSLTVYAAATAIGSSPMFGFVGGPIAAYYLGQPCLSAMKASIEAGITTSKEIRNFLSSSNDMSMQFAQRPR